MRRVQRLIGVNDAKPASLSTSPSNSSMNTYAPANMSASTDTQADFLAPPSSSGSKWQQQQHSSQPPQPMPPCPSVSDTHIGSSRRTPQPESPNSQQHYFDLPPSAQPQSAVSLVPLQAAVSTPVSPRPIALAASIATQPVDRSDLHKSLKALEGLLVHLDEYRDLAVKMAKVEKKLAKSASELEKIKVIREAPSQTLEVSSSMFDALHEVSSKHAKQVQKEYEAINDSCAKYFKKIAKEERAHDELIEALDAKIKKANAAHEKVVKKATANKALESHDKYIATVQGLASEINRAKSSHAYSMGTKSHLSSLMVASTVGGLADLEFRRTCETVKRMGPSVGRLNHLLCFTSSEFMPALQLPDLDESETGRAEELARLSARQESRTQAQAEADARNSKDAEVRLLAQQMGWKPPSPLTASGDPHNLGRVSSFASTNRSASSDSPHKAEVAASYDASADAAQLSSLKGHEQHGANGFDGGPRHVPIAEQRLVSPREAIDRDAVSLKSVATDRTPRQHEQAHKLLEKSQTSVQPSAILPSERAAVQQQDVSMLDHDSNPSNSAQGSEDGGRMPRTPDDSEGASGMPGRREPMNSKALHSDLGSRVSSSVLGLGRQDLQRPAERALEQYRAATSPSDAYGYNGIDDKKFSDPRQERIAQQESFGDRDSPSRKVSLWERERERMKQLEKDTEMQRRVTEEDPRIYHGGHGGDRSSGSGPDYDSRTGSGFYASSRASNRKNTVRPRLSEPPLSDRSSSLGLGYPRPSGDDLDQFAPAVGSTRLSATGVMRSLSTDTTASERSFVSRMKARYQDEKDLEREQRELNVLDKERAARRVTMEPSSRRVPEIASRYQNGASAHGSGSLPLTYAQEVPGRRHHDSLPVTNGSSRLSPMPSTRPPQDSIDEFGAYRKGISRGETDLLKSSYRGPLPSPGQSMLSSEPIHSDVCGCHQCSARHYKTNAKDEPHSAAPINSGKMLSHRPFNTRRTTMPAPIRGDQTNSYESSTRTGESSSAFYATASHRDQLHTPTHAPQARRSFEAEFGVAGDRKVMFAHEPQNMR